MTSATNSTNAASLNVSNSARTAINGISTPAPMNNDTTSPEGDEEDEAKLIEALRQLDDMHAKLINLRRSIPSMIQPINSAHAYSSPEKLFHEFSKRTLKASEDVVEFTTLMVENKWIFERATASRNEDKEGIKRWKTNQASLSYLSKDSTKDGKNSLNVGSEVTELVAGTKRKLDEPNGDLVMEDISSDNGKVMSKEERKEIIDTFKNEHKDFEIEYNEEKAEMRITLPSPSILFTIEIIQSSTVNGGYRYIVTTPQTSFLHIAILRSITTRPNPGDLKFLLDMIFHYTTIYSTRCEKCKHLTGGQKAELPVIRRLIKSVKLVKASTLPAPPTADHAKKEDGSNEENFAGNKAVKLELKEEMDIDTNKEKEKPVEDNVVMKDGAGDKVGVVGENDGEKIDSGNKKMEKNEGEKDGDEDVQITEERWIAYHESCVD